MKFLSWLFNLSQRHRAGIDKYRSGGWGARLISLIVSLVFAALTVGAWFALRNYTGNAAANVDIGELLLSLLFWIFVIGLAYGTVENALVYVVLGIVWAIRGDSDCPRLVDLLFSLLQLAVAVGSVILFLGIIGGNIVLPS